MSGAPLVKRNRLPSSRADDDGHHLAGGVEGDLPLDLVGTGFPVEPRLGGHDEQGGLGRFSEHLELAALGEPHQPA